MAFAGLLRALDGRKDDFLAMHIWQWEMNGSQGSTWNINPAAVANQPDNRPLAQWLSGWIRNLLPGDFNDDGTVDAADYTLWRDSFQQAVTYFAGADGDGSGTIDDGDYEVWKANFGGPLEGATTSADGVPEPATLGLLNLAGVVFLTRRPTRRAS